MNKDIKYSGYTAVPSDYECPDGDLTISLNLINEDGTIKPIPTAKVQDSFDENSQVIFIHKTNAITNYIILDIAIKSAIKLKWKGKNGTSGELTTVQNISHCDAVGNTLIAFTGQSTYFFLWKSDHYILLGDHIPNIQLSFGLVGHPRLYSKSDTSKNTFNVSFAEAISEANIRLDFSENNQNRITEQIMAKVNKFIADQTINKGRFCFPFFVRYALRMYDGTIIGHSNPILMNPQTSAAPLVLWNRVSGKGSYSNADCDIMLMACDLDYQVLATLDHLENWTDLISSVDIFISKPIYTYDQSGTIKNLHDTDNFDSVFIGRLFDKYFEDDKFMSFGWALYGEDAIYGPIKDRDTSFLKHYAEWTYSRIYQLYFTSQRNYPGETFHLPEFDGDKNMELISSCSQFYLLHSIPFDEIISDNIAAATLTAKRKTITINDDYLQSLVTREAMTDDYLSRDKLVANNSQTYNSRLNLSGVKRQPFAGFSPTAMFAFTDRCISTFVVDDSTNEIEVSPSPNSDSVEMDIYLQEGDEVFKLHTAGYVGAFLSTKENMKRSTGCYIFYPNIKATHALIRSSLAYNPDIPYSGGSMVIKLKPHEYLNGSYALLEYHQPRYPNYSDSALPQPTKTISSYNSDAWIDCSSKVYTSEINNPFYFPVTGINTVGTGKILGLATAAKALSQGQFGQFPLYAFTEDGVWAMEVSSTGSYSAKQPITRDVCVNPDAITSIDSGVVFPTSRGLMLISGSQTVCLSDTINTQVDSNLGVSLPYIDDLKRNSFPADALSIPRFAPLMETCRIIYDYPHQRLILFNSDDSSYSYVFSLKSQQWGMMNATFKSALNSYPEALAVDLDNNIVNLSVYRTNINPIKALLITRPLKLDMPDIHKTIDNVIQRGNFAKGHVQSVLYGSRDLLNWHLVWSSKDHFLRGFRGTPYKYFRIALLCNLNIGECVYGAFVQFVPRLSNQPR